MKVRRFFEKVVAKLKLSVAEFYLSVAKFQQDVAEFYLSVAEFQVRRRGIFTKSYLFVLFQNIACKLCYFCQLGRILTENFRYIPPQMLNKC